jgi:hypothetical protein
MSYRSYVAASLIAGRATLRKIAEGVSSSGKYVGEKIRTIEGVTQSDVQL